MCRSEAPFWLDLGTTKTQGVGEKKKLTADLTDRLVGEGGGLLVRGGWSLMGGGGGSRWRGGKAETLTGVGGGRGDWTYVSEIRSTRGGGLQLGRRKNIDQRGDTRKRTLAGEGLGGGVTF